MSKTTKGIRTPLSKDMQEKYDAYHAEAERIDALPFDEWIDWMNGLGRPAGSINMPKSDILLKIIRDGFTHGRDEREQGIAFIAQAILNKPMGLDSNWPLIQEAIDFLMALLLSDKDSAFAAIDIHRESLDRIEAKL